MKRILLLLPFILLWGCVEKHPKNNQCDLTTIPVSFNDNLPIELSDISEETFFVKLATEDSCLIGNIDKIYYVNDHVIIGSDNKVLLFFNKDGSFDHKISRQGNGPGEYARISDFDINKQDNTITILDTGKKQLLKYDWDGNFIDRLSLNSWAIGLQLMNDSVSVLYSGNQISTDNDYKLALYNMYSQSIFNRFYPISSKKSKYLHVYNANNFSKYKDEVLFCELYNDTIYSVFSSGCRPRYYLDFGDEKVPSSFYEEEFGNIMEFQNKFFKHDFSYGINSLANLPSGFIASCYIQKQKHFVYYDKALKKAVTFKNMTDKTNFGDFIIDIVKYNVEFYSDGNYLLMLADNELYMQEEGLAIKERVGDVNFDDNPIVMVSFAK